MHKIIKMMRKYWITIWLVVCVLACASLISYAAYSRINIVKRVITTDEGVGARFSSDCMDSSSAGMTTRKPFASQSDDPLAEVYVFNYPYPKASLYRNIATEYDVVATIGTYDGTTFTQLSSGALAALSDEYYINRNGGSNIKFNANGTASFGCTMAAGKVAPDCFNIHFDNAELGDNPPGCCVEMVATPRDHSLPTLKGYIFVRYVKTVESGWTGSLEELDNSKEYDGYTYILEGSGKGRITFSWDPAFLSINQQFLQNTDNTFYINGIEVAGSNTLIEDSASFPTVDGKKSVTLIVDSQEKNRYEVQFFKTDTSGSNNYQNSVIKNYLPDSNDWVEVSD